ncbi:MAG: hypothetical protein EHM25_00460, partial [Nitrosopumilales archaeon]
MSNSGREITTEPKSGLNYKVLLVIAGLAVIYQTFNYILPEKEGELSPIDYVFTISIVTCAIASFIVTKRYGRSAVFGQAYLALGIAFTAYAIGDIIYNFQTTVLKIDPYPSIADIFFFAQYPFIIFHLIRNIKYFKRKITRRTINWLAAIPITLVLLYSYFTFQQDGYSLFDYYYGLPFVAASATSLSFAILGTQVFRQSALATVWSLLAVGIFLNTFGDINYYYLEIFGLYTRTHFVNVL